MNDAIRLGVVGSRSFTDFGLLANKIDSLPYNIKTIVSGGAIGADSLAEEYASIRGIEFLVHLPDYKTYGKKATFIRNSLIVDDSDVIIAFWDGKSTGTLDTIKKANNQKKPVLIYRTASISTTLDIEM